MSVFAKLFAQKWTYLLLQYYLVVNHGHHTSQYSIIHFLDVFSLEIRQYIHVIGTHSILGTAGYPNTLLVYLESLVELVPVCR